MSPKTFEGSFLSDCFTKVRQTFQFVKLFVKFFLVARVRIELTTFGLWARRATAATISRYIFYSKNFQNKSHKLNLIFSNNQISVGHFFLRFSSHLFHKVKTKFSFCQIYFMKLSLWGCLSFRTWDYKYSLQYPKVN